MPFAMPLWARSIPIWVYAAIIAMGVIGIQQWRIKLSNQRAEAFQSAVETFKSAQSTNLATIKTLQGANADWASKCKANQPEALQQAQASVQADAKRQASAAKSIKLLRATYEHEPTVKAWADTRVPAAVVRMLTASGTH